MRRSALLPLYAVLAVLACGSAQAAGPNSGANAALIQPDGKIVAVGWGETLQSEPGAVGLVRYTQSGTLDPSFGSDGIVTTAYGTWPGDVYGAAAALQPDGKIVVGGGSREGFELSRYDPDGSLDTTFGTNGSVHTAFGTPTRFVGAVAVQPDGKILAVGPLGNQAQSGFALARYNADGSLDTSFGTGGLVTTAITGGVASSVAIQPDGKILVAGSGSQNLQELYSGEFAVARYDADGDGSLDTSFGSGGVVTSAFGLGSAEAHAVALQPDGKILVAGAGRVSVYVPPEIIVARLEPDGSLDASFGSNGVAVAPFQSPGECDECGLYADAVALQPDGKVVTAGESCAGPCVFALARFDPDGMLDTAFGSGGVVTTSSGYSDDCNNDGGAFAKSVALQPDGKIVAAGYSNFGTCSPDYYLVTVARYAADGSLDTSFAGTGIVNTSIRMCVVPRLYEQSFAWAKQALASSDCALGSVSRAYSATVAAGAVISQRPAACLLRTSRTNVSVTVSKGRRPGEAAPPTRTGAIAYDSLAHLGCVGGGSGHSNLWTIEPNGSGRAQLTFGREALHPVWSPDGREVAFGDGPAKGDIVLMDANGRHARVVVKGYASAPTFSPDGRHLAFWRAATCRTCSSGGVIWSVRTDGTGMRKLLSNASYPAWSPDGKHLAFVRRDAAGLDVYIAGPTGRGLRQLTTSGDATAPAWSPNGKQLLVLLAPSSGWQVGVVNVSNGVVHVISRNVDADAQPAWSPNGQRIAYVRYGSKSEQLVTIAATGGDLRVVTDMIGNPSGISWRRG